MKMYAVPRRYRVKSEFPCATEERIPTSSITVLRATFRTHREGRFFLLSTKRRVVNDTLKYQKKSTRNRKSSDIETREFQQIH